MTHFVCFLDLKSFNTTKVSIPWTVKYSFGVMLKNLLMFHNLKHLNRIKGRYSTSSTLWVKSNYNLFGMFTNLKFIKRTHNRYSLDSAIWVKNYSDPFGMISNSEHITNTNKRFPGQCTAVHYGFRVSLTHLICLQT